MVASVDLTRYEPPLDHVLGRIKQLTRLLEHSVDPGFVRDEAATVLQELTEFCRRRVNFVELETRLRDSTSIDTNALDTGLEILRAAPRDESLLSAENVAKKLAALDAHLSVLKKDQHTLKFLEVALRLELVFESLFQDLLFSIVEPWDPSSLVQLARGKIDLLNEQRQRELWSKVLAEFRPFDPDEDDLVLRDYNLEDHGVLPAGFLDPTPANVVDRLALYHAWLRGRVIRAMMQHGRERWPIPAVGLAKILASRRPAEPTTEEVTLGRAVSNIAGWLKLRSEKPLSVEAFGALLGLQSDAQILSGTAQQEFAERSWDQKFAPEYAALHSFKTLATTTASMHEYQTPLAVALFQYKAGIELFAPAIASTTSSDELVLQKQLCKFLLERGIFSVGTKFGQSETDLVTNERDEICVIEAKVIRSAPSATTLPRNVMQLLRYDDLNPALRGARGVLILYNFSDVPILTPRELVGGNARVVAVNVKAGPPSKTKKCLQLVVDAAQGLRCVDWGAPKQPLTPASSSARETGGEARRGSRTSRMGEPSRDQRRRKKRAPSGKPS